MLWGDNLPDEVQGDDEVLNHGSDEEEIEWHDPDDAQDSDDSNLDSESDDGLLEASHGPGTTNEKKRFMDQIFKAFSVEQTEKITAKEVQEAIEGKKDEELSIRNILAKQENSTHITTARDYQIELFQKAKVENIIAVLDTGSGKTHIATLLLRYILDKELEDRAKGNTRKIAFFLVNSVNLVFQQSTVLQSGLSQTVQGICGSMGASLWGKHTWDKLLSQNFVIVCTAEVLLQCLMHSFITIPEINLLIFDEAHHTKSNHAYARIMKDYYVQEPDLTQRPRIFGMTASPVDANVDIKQAAMELETLLHCKICTTSDLTLLQSHIHKPTEEVAVYSRLPSPFETSFHQDLKSRYGNNPIFEKFFINAKLLSSELGSWASDAYWSFAVSEEEGKKLEMRQGRMLNKAVHDHSEAAKEKETEIEQLKKAVEFVKGHDFGFPTPDLESLSSKVLLLHGWLERFYKNTDEARCIIFIERRQTARLLNMIFKRIGGPNLHTDILVGINSRVEDENVSLKAQVMTVAKFRRGELNCLFATSVAEEGLDIPQCNLVVRFDLYKTMITYVQSRGRARHKYSVYLHMIEEGNFNHALQVRTARAAETVMKSFCNGLPTDRLIDALDTAEGIVAGENGFPSYTDPNSGAKLTFRSAQAILAHFVSMIPISDRTITLQATYVVEKVGGKFVCEVILPDCSPVTTMRGLPYRKKAIAKCSAAFEMCVELRKKGFLDDRLLPTYKRVLPAMRNAMLAVSTKKKGLYKMRIKPEFWNFGYETIPTKLYLTVIDVSDGLDRPHQPIGFITRAVFPEMPQFPVFLTDGRPSEVISTPILTAFPVSAEKVKLLTTLTLTLYKDIFAKWFEYAEERMSYWMVPLNAKMTKSFTPIDDPESFIDWDQVHEIVEKEEYRWDKNMSNDFLADKYIIDPNDGGRRFYSHQVAPQYKATDPVPTTAPAYKYMKDILDYSVSLWAKSRQKWEDVWDRSQPVMEVEKIPFRRNFLARPEKDEEEVRWNPIAYVCPQPLKISAITTPFVAMCYVFPAIIHRFEAYMVALDACNRLELNIGPRLALEALTKDSENSEEHGDQMINFKSGMGPNYERLEFMGDCYLKMATSISTFVQRPDDNEFEFHVRRMVMLCNQNLYNAAIKHKLYEYVRTMAFSRRTWYPEGIKLTKGKGAKQIGTKDIHHRLADKSVADVCEAFIGAAFMQHNDLEQWDPKNWDEATKAVTKLVDSEDHVMEKYSDYYAAYIKPTYTLAEPTASHLDLARQVEKKHPYHFKYPRLVRSAFIHPSQAFIWEQIPNYQRLEFLGDSLLDQVFIMYLFNRYPDKDPQWLTEHKMPMVTNKFLAAVCVSLGFHKHMRQNNTQLATQIRDYVVEVEEARDESHGNPIYWTQVSEPPKCLADIVEAFVGALFVDAEFDFGVVQHFFDIHLKHYFLDMTLYDSFAGNHPQTRLSILLNKNFGCTHWRTAVREQESVIPGAMKQVIAMVQIHYKVFFHAIATSGRYARAKVAREAVEKLEGLPPYEFQRMYGCDCADKADEEGVDGVNGMSGVDVLNDMNGVSVEFGVDVMDGVNDEFGEGKGFMDGKNGLADRPCMKSANGERIQRLDGRQTSLFRE